MFCSLFIQMNGMKAPCEYEIYLLLSLGIRFKYLRQQNKKWHGKEEAKIYSQATLVGTPWMDERMEQNHHMNMSDTCISAWVLGSYIPCGKSRSNTTKKKPKSILRQSWLEFHEWMEQKHHMNMSNTYFWAWVLGSNIPCDKLRSHMTKKKPKSTLKHSWIKPHEWMEWKHHMNINCIYSSTRVLGSDISCSKVRSDMAKKRPKSTSR
jgi:hypothetical protein